jgi:phosphatidylserine/phosphatidylglycerophosphate/cardiolipin synthase-like enzyme
MSKKHALEWAEYISLGFACTGLIAATVYQQVAYAAIPLMINLPIGLTNRQRLDRRIREISTQVLPSLTQNSDYKIENLSKDLIDLKRLYLELDTNHQSLRDRDLNLNVLEQQLSILTHQIVKFEQKSLEVESNITTLLDRSIDEGIDRFNKIIQENQKNLYYELVIDRAGSRQVLIDSLQQAEDQIVIICPWVSGYVIREIDTYIEAALERNVKVSIGWGHLNDTRTYRAESNDLYNNLNRNNLLKLNRQQWKYGGIPILEKMQIKYQDRLTLKVIGTHEKFLVCDRKMAMIGSHNFLTSGESSPERELGLKTNDPYIIDLLIARFNQPNIHEIYGSDGLN